MCLKLLLLFIAVPFVEVWILIELSRRIGFWPMVGVQIVTGVIGASLAKMEGLAIWDDVQKELASGRVPKKRVLDGLLVLIAGIVLLTPGLLTDLLGLILLFPLTRAPIRRYLEKRFKSHLGSGGPLGGSGGGPFGGSGFTILTGTLPTSGRKDDEEGGEGRDDDRKKP